MVMSDTGNSVTNLTGRPTESVSVSGPRISRTRVLGSVLFVLSFLPYLGFSAFGSDTQPWAFLFALVIVFTYAFKNGGRIRFSKPFLLFLFANMYAVGSFVLVLLLFENGDFVSGLRSLVSLWSIPLIAVAVVVTRGALSARLFYMVFALWFLVGLAQLLYPGDLNIPFLVRSSMSPTRGVTSLAPEPVWYARTEILFMALSVLLFIRGKISRRAVIWINVLGSFQIVVLSQAGLGFVYLAVYWLLLVLTFLNRVRRIMAVVLVLLSLISVLAIGTHMYPNLRVFHLATLAVSNPTELWNYSGVRIRVSNPVFAGYVGLIHTRGLGVGVGTAKQAADLPDWLIQLRFSGREEPYIGGRAHGGFPGVVYELGIIGLFWILGFIGAWRYAYERVRFQTRKAIVFSGAVLLSIVFFESTLANPMIGYVLGMMTYCGRSDGN